MSATTTIYRVQDAEGRGPYRPGFSHQWVDPDWQEHLRPPFFEEFGMHVIQKALYGQAVGCGFRDTAQLKRWFAGKNELHTLLKMGYSIVKMDVDAILGESAIQLVFARNKPLNKDVSKVLIIKLL